MDANAILANTATPATDDEIRAVKAWLRTLPTEEVVWVGARTRELTDAQWMDARTHELYDPGAAAEGPFAGKTPAEIGEIIAAWLRR